MGVGSSQAVTVVDQGNDCDADGNEVWVQLKARTTDKTTRAVVEHRWAVRASKAGVTLGSDAATAGIAIADSAVSAGNARLLLTAAGEVAVEPQGRVYSMVGQRAGRGSSSASGGSAGVDDGGAHVLAPGSVIKLGACSLAVTDIVLTDDELRSRHRSSLGGTGHAVPPAVRRAEMAAAADAAASAAVAAPASAGATDGSPTDPLPPLLGQGSKHDPSVTALAGDALTGGTPADTAASNTVDDAGTQGAVGTDAVEVVEAAAAAADTTGGQTSAPVSPGCDDSHLHEHGDSNSSSGGRDAMCYICFDDADEPGNPLINSVCSCAKLVHRLCLRRWMSTTGSRTCSICKARLPVDITAEPPFLVLQVVRHMRGLHWVSDREYVVHVDAAAGKWTSTIGSSPADVDVAIPDPSLSHTHARITYVPPVDAPARQPTAQAGAGTAATPRASASASGSAAGASGRFVVEDCQSSSGTFVRLDEPLVIPRAAEAAPGGGRAFKMGRTVVSMKVTRKRGAAAGGADVAGSNVGLSRTASLRAAMQTLKGIATGSSSSRRTASAGAAVPAVAAMAAAAAHSAPPINHAPVPTLVVPIPAQQQQQQLANARLAGVPAGSASRSGGAADPSPLLATPEHDVVDASASQDGNSTATQVAAAQLADPTAAGSPSQAGDRHDSGGMHGHQVASEAEAEELNVGAVDADWDGDIPPRRHGRHGTVVSQASSVAFAIDDEVVRALSPVAPDTSNTIPAAGAEATAPEGVASLPRDQAAAVPTAARRTPPPPGS